MKIKFFKSFLSLIVTAIITSTFYSLAKILELGDIGIFLMCVGGLIMSGLFAMMIFEPEPKIVRVEKNLREERYPTF